MKVLDINGKERECVGYVLDKGFPDFVRVEYKSKIRKGYTHTEWYPLNIFKKNNPELASKFKKTPQRPPEDLGIVSSSGKNYIKDTTKNWRANIYKGFPLWISRGKGEGQQRKVVKNNKNTIYVKKEWDVKPNKTSQYVLSENVQDNIEAQGNTLPDEVTMKMMQDLLKKAEKGVKITN